MASVAGAASLQIPPSARFNGLGQSGVALADDATAAWWNPAGLGFMTGRTLGLMHSQLVPDLADDISVGSVFSDRVGREIVDRMVYDTPQLTAFIGSELRGDDGACLAPGAADAGTARRYAQELAGRVASVKVPQATPNSLVTPTFLKTLLPLASCTSITTSRSATG